MSELDRIRRELQEGLDARREQEENPEALRVDRRTVHMVSETAALALVLPMSIYAAASPRLPIWARVGFGIVAAGTAVVDSALLASYVKDLKRRRGTS